MNPSMQTPHSKHSQTWVRRAFLTLAGLACLSAIAVGARAVSTAMSKPPVPPVIAVVELDVLFKGLDEHTVKMAELQIKVKESNTKLEKLKKELDDLKTQMETASPADKPLIEQKARLKKAELELEFNSSEKRLGDLYGDLFREMHVKIASACVKLAKQNGYTMVMSNTENSDIPHAGVGKVMEAISIKTMLYVDDAHDITAEVVTLMNNEYAAIGGKAPPPPAPAPPANGAKPVNAGGKP